MDKIAHLVNCNSQSVSTIRCGLCPKRDKDRIIKF